MRALAVLALSAVLGIGSGCGHAGAKKARPDEKPDVAWPAPPESARVRLSFVLTVRKPEPPRRWWRTALRWLTGTSSLASRQLLVRPFDVAVTNDNDFLVADPDSAAVVRYSADGTFLSDVVCKGRPWTVPMSVATADAEIFVADAGAGTIFRLHDEGCMVIRPSDLERPTGIALAPGRLFVADPPSHRVLVLSREGDVIGSWGERGEGDGQFNYPTDVASAPDGSIYVVDALNFRIAHLSPEGKWLGTFGSPGEEGAGLERPKGVDVDEAGSVYVTDAQRDIALVFGPDGTFEYAIGDSGESPGRFSHPAGVDARGGRLLVADSLNHRVQVFEFSGEAR